MLLSLNACSAQPESTKVEPTRPETKAVLTPDPQAKATVGSENKQTKSETISADIGGPEFTISISQRLNASLIECKKIQTQDACNDARDKISQGIEQLNAACPTGKEYACSISKYQQIMLSAVSKVEKQCITKEQTFVDELREMAPADKKDFVVPPNKQEQIAALTAQSCENMKRYAGK
jgi:hypothetical protein